MQMFGPVRSISEAQLPSSTDGVYEGAVLLKVDANDDNLQLFHFIRRLRQVPQLRVLRLYGKRGSAEISMGLREPIHLMDLLAKIPGVQRVRTLYRCAGVGGDQDQEVGVWLWSKDG